MTVEGLRFTSECGGLGSEKGPGVGSESWIDPMYGRLLQVVKRFCASTRARERLNVPMYNSHVCTCTSDEKSSVVRPIISTLHELCSGGR